MYSKCPYCGKCLTTVGVEETRLNNLYQTNTSAAWAKAQLKTLHEMAEYHHLDPWYVEEVKRILDGISVTS